MKEFSLLSEVGMNININNAAGLKYTNNINSNNRAEDKRLKSIYEQIDNAKEQLRGLAEDEEMSPEMKQERRKELNEQIKELNKQLIQRQAELRREAAKQKEGVLDNKKTDKAEARTRAKNGIHGSLDKKIVKGLVAADNTIELSDNDNRVKTGLEGNARVLKSDIENDSKRGFYSESKAEGMGKLEGRIKDIDTDISEELKEAKDELEDSRAAAQENKKEEERIRKRIEKEEKTDNTAKGSGKNNKILSEGAIPEEKERHKKHSKEEYKAIDIKL